MGAFFFIRHFTVVSSGDSIADTLFDAVKKYPHDDAHHAVKDEITLGESSSHCYEKSSLVEDFTFIVDNSYFYLVGDIRLDNRSELIERLELSSDDSWSNEEIILRTYLRFGEDFADCLLGDFAFVLHDLQNSTTLAVRDHLGVIPLYYHANTDFILISDTIEVILSHPSIDHGINDNVAMEFLVAGHVHNQRETFYTVIQKLPRATQIRFNDPVLTYHTYWNSDHIPPLHYESEAEYIDHLKALLERVITDRLQTSCQSSAHLSGGLDSSVIAVAAGREVHKKGSVFYTYNWCKPGIGDDPDHHEWADARSIAKEEGFIHSEIDYTAQSAIETLLSHNIATSGTTMFEYEHLVLPLAAQQGVKIIFSGFGGDEMLTMRFKNTHIDLIRKGKFYRVWRGLENEMAPKVKLKTLRLSKRFIRLLFKSIIPQRQRECKVCETQKRKFSNALSIIHPEYTEMLNIDDFFSSAFAQVDTIHAMQHSYLSMGYHQERMECWNIMGKKHGITYVYPYLDKRIVEFALSLPEKFYFKHGESRYLYRRAVGEFLPRELLDKQKPPESYRVHHLLKRINEGLGDQRIEEYMNHLKSPYIDTSAWRQKYDELQTRIRENPEDIIVLSALAAFKNSVLFFTLRKSD